MAYGMLFVHTSYIKKNLLPLLQQLFRYFVKMNVD